MSSPPPPTDSHAGTEVHYYPPLVEVALKVRSHKRHTVIDAKETFEKK